MQHKKTDIFTNIEKFINEYKEQTGGASPTVRDISNAVGISPATVSRYMNTMRDSGVLEFNGHRNISTRQSKEAESLQRVPVLGRVSCGLPKFAEENIEEYVRMPVSIFGKGDYFLLRAAGDSMTDAGIDDGDLVLVRQQNTAEYNQIVVALIDDEATLKRFRPVGDCIILHPENKNYKDIIVESCMLQGVAVKIIKDIA